MDARQDRVAVEEDATKFDELLLTIREAALTADENHNLLGADGRS
jgi:hypothetical protein